MIVYAINAKKPESKDGIIPLSEKYLKEVQEGSFVCFPEYHLTDPLGRYDGFSLKDPVVRSFASLAKKYRIHIASGIVEKTRGSRYVCGILIDSEGMIIGKQRKLRPTSFEREAGILAGNKKKIIETNFATISFSLCRDQWFIEDGGAEIILHLRGFGLENPKYGNFTGSWFLLDRATAMLKKAYVIGCTGAIGRGPLADVIDFEGTVLGRSDLEGRMEADIDLEKLREYRGGKFVSRKVPKF